MVSSGLLAGALVLSVLFLCLLLFSFVFHRLLLSRRDAGGPVDLTDEHGVLDPVKQIKHLKKTTAEFGIKYDELKFGKMLGKGSQGEVFKATWRGSTVAVKRVDTRKVPPEIIDEFTQEAVIMRRLRHPCLTLFMGVSLEHPHLCIVTEVVARGSLFDIIHDEHAALTWNKCLGIALDVARGMTYLHSFRPPILHRDLKSLNILVDENWRGKVADFGMTRFQEDGTMTQCGSPLWMAPEMIRNDAYGEAADVFSFAICLWEMYTRKIPYRDLGLNPSHLVVKVVKEHLRPPIPKQCPKAFKNLMEKCWNPVAEKRPTFAQILKVMEGFMQDPAILNHKPMSSRDSTVIVRPERTDDGGDAAITGIVGGALGAMGAALGLASGEKQWKIDSKEVAFYNESAATYADLAAAGAIPESLATPGGKAVRSRSTQNLSLLINPDTIASKAAAPASSTGTTAPATPDAGEQSQADTAVGTGELKRASSRNDKRSSKEKASKPATPSGSQPPSPSGKAKSPASATPVASMEGVPAPLVLNTAIVATKDAKSARGGGGGGGEEAQPLGLQLASQGRGLLLGRFRNKVVTVKPSYLSRSHLVLSNEERVAADLDGGMKDTKVGLMMKRISALRHPNITLFMGAFVDGVENLKTKLKESGLPELGKDDAMQKDITNLSVVVNPSASSAASSSSSSSSGTHVGSSAAFPVGLPAPPPGCDYYLGYVQEHMLRGTLHDIFCDSHLVLDWDTMLQLLIDAAAGLTYLHGSGPIIHQDLTSHRLLVDKSYRVKVSEYGFVDLQAQLTGTPLPPSPWSSPEYIKQPNQVNLSCASNVYSFGQ
jgi:serine/threonine protein kinase